MMKILCSLRFSDFKQTFVGMGSICKNTWFFSRDESDLLLFDKRDRIVRKAREGYGLKCIFLIQFMTIW